MILWELSSNFDILLNVILINLHTINGVLPLVDCK